MDLAVVQSIWRYAWSTKSQNLAWYFWRNSKKKFENESDCFAVVLPYKSNLCFILLKSEPTQELAGLTLNTQWQLAIAYQTYMSVKYINMFFHDNGIHLPQDIEYQYYGKGRPSGLTAKWKQWYAYVKANALALTNEPEAEKKSDKNVR